MATLREPELMRRRGIGQPLQVAEHDGCAKPLGQAIDLLVEDLPIGVVLRREIAFGGPLRDELVERVPTCRALASAIGHALSDPEQPARDRPAPADGPGPVGQDEEDGLKGILRIVRVVKNAPADTEHHRAVSDHQLFKGRLRGLIAPRDESVQELRIGHRPDRSEIEQPVHLPVHPVRMGCPPFLPISSVVGLLRVVPAQQRSLTRILRDRSAFAPIRHRLAVADWSDPGSGRPP